MFVVFIIFSVNLNLTRRVTRFADIIKRLLLTSLCVLFSHFSICIIVYYFRHRSLAAFQVLFYIIGLTNR